MDIFISYESFGDFFEDSHILICSKECFYVEVWTCEITKDKTLRITFEGHFSFIKKNYTLLEYTISMDNATNQLLTQSCIYRGIQLMDKCNQYKRFSFIHKCNLIVFVALIE